MDLFMPFRQIGMSQTVAFILVRRRVFLRAKQDERPYPPQHASKGLDTRARAESIGAPGFAASARIVD